MKLKLLVPVAALLALLGCEAPPTALNDDASVARSSATEQFTADAFTSAAKGGNAGFSTEMNQLLARIRSATARFHRPEAAEEAGYQSTHECAANPFGPGAMGVHFINPGLLFSEAEAGTFDPLRPEVLVYEPQKNGRMRLVAIEYLIFKDAWVQAGNSPDDAPTLLGQEFVKSFGPAAHGLPDHYELHVWLWRNNPDGLFAQWNPQVSCPPQAE